jgi:hypothetical protein
MIRSVGRGLQLLALIALPLAMALQIANRLSLGNMLIILVSGAAAFWLGRIIEGYA